MRFYCLCIPNLVHSEEQSSVTATLDKIEAGNVSLHSKAAGELTAIQESIQQLKTTLATQLSGASGTISSDLSGPLAAIQKVLSTILARLHAVPKPSKVEENILRRLHFPQIWSREEAVGKAEFDTFNWFLEPEVDLNVRISDDSEHGFLSEYERDALEQARRQFLEWLETGSLVHHITGKAGSGKSTLMKFLYQHPRVRELLQRWAGPKKLVIVGFFFWSSGTREEKSLQGLYQSVLFQTLQQCPELIQLAFPRYGAKNSHNLDNLDTTTPFRLSELRRAMELLVSQDDHNMGHRFFFFVDGLDEFEVGLNTDYRDLADDILSWAQSPGVKLCVSSRPYVEFFEGFPASQRIALNDLTREDLRRFVSGALSKENALDNEMVSCLSRVITDRAQGVFLWVRLVVRSVVEGMRHKYPLRTLLQRVEGLPRGLEPLYVQLFESIESYDRERSDMMFLIAASVDTPLNALLYSWVDDLLDPEFPFNLPIRAYADDEVLSRHEIVKFQLYGLSKGLLEIRQNHGGYLYWDFRVDFMHRTVRDFLKKPEMIKTMVQRRFGSENSRLHVRQLIHRLVHAEFKFAGPGPKPYAHSFWRGLLESSFYNLLGLTTSCNTWTMEPRVLEAHGRALSHYAQKYTSCPLPWGLSLGGCHVRKTVRIELRKTPDMSYNHYMAAYTQCHEHMRSVVTKLSKDSLAREGPSLLFTSIYAAMADRGRASDLELPAGHVRLYSHILQAGISPHDEFPMVRSRRPDSVKQNLMVTPWLAFLQLRANKLVDADVYRGGRSIADFTTRFWSIVEALLAFGADPDVFFDFSLFSQENPRKTPRRNALRVDEPDDLVSVSLLDLVLVDRPPNRAAILERISARQGSWLWESTRRAAEILSPWAGVQFGAPKLKPAQRRLSVTELEGYLQDSRTTDLLPYRVYTLGHDITIFDTYRIY
jgi:hypothetical protein